MAKKTTKKTEREQRLEAAVERVRKILGIETFETRSRDALDFHDISVRALREAVLIAFDAGYEAGLHDGELLTG